MTSYSSKMAESLPSVSYSGSFTDTSDCDSDSDSVAENVSASKPDVPSLLDRLKSPAMSELARKRKMKGTPAKRKKISKGAVVAEPLSVAPSKRIKEFPDEKLSVVSGKLFCTACRENLSLPPSPLL